MTNVSLKIQNSSCCTLNKELYW